MSIMCFSYKRLHKVLKKKNSKWKPYLVLKKEEEQNSRFFEHQF